MGGAAPPARELGGALALISMLAVDDRPEAAFRAVRAGTTVAEGVAYWADLFPWLLVMAVGAGLVMVGLTPTSLRRVAVEHTDVGSGLFNTTQQLGGAISLAVLSTVALYGSDQRAAQDLGPVTAALGADQDAVQQALLQSTFTDGAPLAFGVGALLLLAASSIIWFVVRPGRSGRAR